MFADNAKYAYNTMNLMNLDLPKLRSITSDEDSFSLCRIVKLESTKNIEY